MTATDVAWAALWLVLGVVGGAVLRPGGARLERWARGLWNEDPLIVHIESDPEILFAGTPDWEGFSRWLPDARVLALASMPSGRWDWLRWVQAQGGQPVGPTKLRVTLQAKNDTAVVIDRIRAINVVHRNVPPGGVIVTRAVGGADMTERHFTVMLDSAASSGQEALVLFEGEPRLKNSLALAAGDVERFEVHVEAHEGWFEWSLELLLLVEGRRVIRTIDSNGQPFITIGESGLDHLIHDSSGIAMTPPSPEET